MAQSRLEKIGTIFTRVTGLLRSGAMKLEDKPIWYDVYAAFPPKLEPRYDRPAPEIPIRKIFYAEDVIRAKYHKSNAVETMNLSDTKHQTSCQQFIEIYKDLQAQGAMDDEKIAEVAKQMLQEKVKSKYPDRVVESTEEHRPGLVGSFSEAKSGPAVDVRDIFKD